MHFPFLSDDEIQSIGRGLVDLTLPKTSWTHAAHFAATLWLMKCCPEVEASRDLPGIIRAYNEANGVANTDKGGYHETITQASIRGARAFLAEEATQPLFVTCNTLLKSPLGRSDWLFEYWSRPRLFSIEARQRWLEPDIRRLPF